MSVGKILRNILGKKLFKVIGGLYKSIFYNIDYFISTLPDIENIKFLLDIGGGDGEPINKLLKVNSNINVTMIDVANEIGNSIEKIYLNNITIFPNITLKSYCENNIQVPDHILISDVLHHIKEKERVEMILDLSHFIKSKKCNIIVKDFEPGYFRSYLGYWADLYISGDKNTNLIGKSNVVTLFENVFECIEYVETDLFVHDKPNYCLIFKIN